ncbi:MAG: N-acetylmuramoyl-L-alanine amidase [Muribaculum sp.]|nr:N-acetylmuramoyl-L-alanine amidase [Muribaculum sp.]
MMILIDNGHGADTTGKRSPDGVLREYSYCREIAAEVVSRLKKAGKQAALLVPEQTDVPLSERVRRANSYCARLGAANVCLVSIHCNAAGSGADWMNARGWEAWTSVGQTRGDRLADCLYAAAESVLKAADPVYAGKIRKDSSDGDPDKESNFTILKKTQCAAVLTENLFQDNRQDVDFLLSAKGREAIVSLHVKGILSYL